ncbi:unnamed protein product [Ilex paraguariensis]|uniref:MADS-box domain-containing protein n=1 Tax=Ilex paraguariensis TaxID=185542 RepID=A0ABC8RKH4_9AQUA
MARRKGMGRSKVVLKRIENKNSRQTTFSKRRTGLFKKANELCERCGAQAAVITFSMAGNLYASGHPNVDAVIDQYLARTSSDEVEEKYAEALAKLEAEKKRDKILDRAVEKIGGGSLLDAPIEAFEIQELEEIIAIIEEMMNNVVVRDNDKRENPSEPDDPCDVLSLDLSLALNTLHY